MEQYMEHIINFAKKDVVPLEKMNLKFTTLTTLIYRHLN